MVFEVLLKPGSIPICINISMVPEINLIFRFTFTALNENENNEKGKYYRNLGINPIERND